MDYISSKAKIRKISKGVHWALVEILQNARNLKQTKKYSVLEYALLFRWVVSPFDRDIGRLDATLPGDALKRASIVQFQTLLV